MTPFHKFCNLYILPCRIQQLHCFCSCFKIPNPFNHVSNIEVIWLAFHYICCKLLLVLNKTFSFSIDCFATNQFYDFTILEVDGHLSLDFSFYTIEIICTQTRHNDSNSRQSKLIDWEKDYVPYGPVYTSYSQNHRLQYLFYGGLSN